MSARLRALVVGSGHRVRNAFLPALSCLDSHLEVVAIYSRTYDNARRVGLQWSVEAIESPNALRPGDVDLALVSVTVANNVAALKAIAHLAPGAALIIDTPAVGRIRDLARLAEFRRWARIRVAEDFMNMPQYRLVNQLISTGILGEVSRVSLSEMGYRNHALALVRSWLGFASPRFSRSRRRAGGVDIEYRFPGHKVGEVHEPYRRAQGFFSVGGSRGLLTGHPMGHELAEAGPYRLARRQHGESLAGFGIDGLDTPMEIGLPYLAQLRDMHLEDDSEFNLLRVEGLCTVISSLWESDPLNNRYRLEDAIADKLVSWAARRVPLLAVPPAWTTL